MWKDLALSQREKVSQFSPSSHSHLDGNFLNHDKLRRNRKKVGFSGWLILFDHLLWILAFSSPLSFSTILILDPFFTTIVAILKRNCNIDDRLIEDRLFSQLINIWKADARLFCFCGRDNLIVINQAYYIIFFHILVCFHSLLTCKSLAKQNKPISYNNIYINILCVEAISSNLTVIAVYLDQWQNDNTPFPCWVLVCYLFKATCYLKKEKEKEKPLQATFTTKEKDSACLVSLPLSLDAFPWSVESFVHLECQENYPQRTRQGDRAGSSKAKTNDQLKKMKVMQCVGENVRQRAILRYPQLRACTNTRLTWAIEVTSFGVTYQH